MGGVGRAREGGVERVGGGGAPDAGERGPNELVRLFRGPLDI